MEELDALSPAELAIRMNAKDNERANLTNLSQYCVPFFVSSTKPILATKAVNADYIWMGHVSVKPEDFVSSFGGLLSDTGKQYLLFLS
jgi:hypothetical protein